MMWNEKYKISEISEKFESIGKFLVLENKIGIKINSNLFLTIQNNKMEK